MFLWLKIGVLISDFEEIERACVQFFCVNLLLAEIKLPNNVLVQTLWWCCVQLVAQGVEASAVFRRILSRKQLSNKAVSFSYFHPCVFDAKLNYGAPQVHLQIQRLWLPTICRVEGMWQGKCTWFISSLHAPFLFFLPPSVLCTSDWQISKIDPQTPALIVEQTSRCSKRVFIHLFKFWLYKPTEDTSNRLWFIISQKWNRDCSERKSEIM